MKKPNYRPTGFFVLRAPLLPVDTRLSRRDLHVVLEDPVLREAVFIASPSFAEAIEDVLEDGENGDKAARSAFRYVSRASRRCTPFGLFAGNGVGAVGERTELVLLPREQARRIARLDMGVLTDLVRRLESDPEERKSLRFEPNSSIYRACGRIRFAELGSGGDSDSPERFFPLVDVEPSPHIDTMLEAAQDGRTLSELASVLSAKCPEMAAREAQQFAEDLAKVGLLVPTAMPRVTGDEPALGVISELDSASKGTKLLTRVRAEIQTLNIAALGVPTARYGRISRELAEAGLDVKPGRALQVDMVRSLERATVGPAVVAEVQRVVDLLRTWPNQENSELADFVKKFRARYESREVSLPEVLDEALGIGFGPAHADHGPLVPHVPALNADTQRTSMWTAADDHRLQRLVDAVRRREREIEITINADAPKGGKGAQTDAFCAYFTILAASGQEVDAGRFRLLWRGVISPSGSQFFARFCHADPELLRDLRRHLAHEAELATDAILADVVHLPRGRLGNVMLRPLLRDYEIVYNARSGAPADRQIPLSDLLVCIEGGQVVLRSRRLGKRMLVRITNAHNLRQPDALPVYRFLGALQSQDAMVGSFSWGALGNSDYLPRVTSGQTILSPAIWTLHKARIATLTKVPAAERVDVFRRLRDELGLPRHVSVAEGDNILEFDLEEALDVDVLVHHLKKRTSERLSEVFGLTEEDLVVRGPEGRYRHEILLPFVRVPHKGEPVRRPPVAKTERSVPAVPRMLAPGSECLFTKIYADASSFQEMLTGVVRKVTSAALASGAVRSWFFVRYADPEPHLRIRFFGTPARLLGEVLPALSEELSPSMADGRVHKLVLDSYDREIERYGGHAGIELAEDIFCADSEGVLDAFDALADSASEDDHWRAAFFGASDILIALGLDAESRRRVFARLNESYQREFNVPTTFLHEASAFFRKERPSLLLLLEPNPMPETPLGRACGALRARRTASMGEAVRKLSLREARGELTSSLAELAPSFVHMHVDRFLGGPLREQELLLYYLLDKAHAAAAAMAKNRSSTIK